MLTFSASRRELRHRALLLDPWAWLWAEVATEVAEDAEAVTPRDAVRRLQNAGVCRQVPIGIVGPRDPSGRERKIAEALGEAVGGLGVPVLCGGKTGVMEAVARGAKRVGALTIGIVPDNEWRRANDYIDLPLATGLGPARNVLVARMSLALVAVGGQYGTITEVAYGLHFDKPVFGLEGAPDIEGVRRMTDPDAVVAALAPIILNLPDLS